MSIGGVHVNRSAKREWSAAAIGHGRGQPLPRTRDAERRADAGARSVDRIAMARLCGLRIGQQSGGRFTQRCGQSGSYYFYSRQCGRFDRFSCAVALQRQSGMGRSSTTRDSGCRAVTRGTGHARFFENRPSFQASTAPTRHRRQHGTHGRKPLVDTSLHHGGWRYRVPIAPLRVVKSRVKSIPESDIFNFCATAAE